MLMDLMAVWSGNLVASGSYTIYHGAEVASVWHRGSGKPQKSSFSLPSAQLEFQLRSYT